MELLAMALWGLLLGAPSMRKRYWRRKRELAKMRAEELFQEFIGNIATRVAWYYSDGSMISHGADEDAIPMWERLPVDRVIGGQSSHLALR